MKIFRNFFIFSLCFLFLGYSQKDLQKVSESLKIPGTKSYCEPDCNSADPAGKFGNAPLANGNGSIATSYTYSACGLDYTYY